MYSGLIAALTAINLQLHFKTQCHHVVTLQIFSVVKAYHF